MSDFEFVKSLIGKQITLIRPTDVNENVATLVVDKVYWVFGSLGNGIVIYNDHEDRVAITKKCFKVN